MTAMDAGIRDALLAHGHLAVGIESIPEEGDLYRAGLTSHASVNVMLALEDTFDVEFPDHMLRKKTFESVAAIQAALVELLGASNIVT